MRACFHVGSSYEFHQSEGLSPTLYNYIVGDVTVEQMQSRQQLLATLDRARRGFENDDR